MEPPFIGIPAVWKNADAAAIQALHKGKANKDQQKRALNFIMYNISECDGFDYRTNDRDHAFGSGKRWVGVQLKKLISINLMADQFKEDHGK